MKTERRHELQKNELADALGKEITAVKPYWKLIVGGVVALVAVGISLLAYSQSQKESQQRAWKPFLKAQSKAMVDRDPEVLAKLATVAEGTSVASVADLLAADREMADGIRLLYLNRKDADTHLTKAAENYDLAQQRATSSQTEFKVRALLGLASAQECLRNVDKAREALEAAKAAAPDTALGKEAARRLQLLNDHKDFYAWFESNPPVSPHDVPPTGGKPLVDPAFKLNEVPDSPDIKFSNPPDKSASTPPADPKPAGEVKPGETTKSPEEAKPADAKPAETKPEEAKPAETKAAEKPAEANPAEEAKPAEEKKPDPAPPASPAPAK